MLDQRFSFSFDFHSTKNFANSCLNRTDFTPRSIFAMLRNVSIFDRASGVIRRGISTGSKKFEEIVVISCSLRVRQLQRSNMSSRKFIN